jgi:hypothetical protein
MITIGNNQQVLDGDRETLEKYSVTSSGLGGTTKAHYASNACRTVWDCVRDCPKLAWERFTAIWNSSYGMTLFRRWILVAWRPGSIVILIGIITYAVFNAAGWMITMICLTARRETGSKNRTVGKFSAIVQNLLEYAPNAKERTRRECILTIKFSPEGGNIYE